MTDPGSILTSVPDGRPATRGLNLSQPRYRLLDYRNYQRSGTDVDRAVLGIKSFEAAPSRA